MHGRSLAGLTPRDKAPKSKCASRARLLATAALALVAAWTGVALAETPAFAPDADMIVVDTDDAGAAEASALAEAAPSAAPLVSATATPPPSAAAAPVDSTGPAPQAAPSGASEAPVRVGDATVFVVHAGYGTQTAKARADAASAALKQAVARQKPEDVRVEDRADASVVYVDKTPIIELHAEDARSAGASSVKDHAAVVAAQVREAIRREQKRSAIANTVFSLSLVVLAALFAIYLLRKLAEFTERARSYLVKHPDRVPALRIYSLEVVRPAALRSALVVGFGALRFIGQIGIGYLWLLGTLSLFETTRPYTQKLTSLVVSPITGLVGRTVATLPMLVVTIIATVAVLVVLRFVAMFFASVARGETHVEWVSAERATPTSTLLRVGIVAAVLVFAAPVVTGDEQGALARVGTVVVASLGLAATPLLATALAGAAVLYSRRLSPGDLTRIGSHTGRVKSIGLVDVQIETEQGALVRVPHLLLLFKTSELVPGTRERAIDVVVSAAAKPTNAGEALLEAARRLHADAKVELVSASADGLSFRVLLSAEVEASRSEVLAALLDALGERGIGLGRGQGAGDA